MVELRQREKCNSYISEKLIQGWRQDKGAFVTVVRKGKERDGIWGVKRWGNARERFATREVGKGWGQREEG